MAKSASPLAKRTNPVSSEVSHKPVLQPKMAVSSAYDRFEAEADRVAAHAVSPDAAYRSPPSISRLYGSPPASPKRRNWREGGSDTEAIKGHKQPEAVPEEQIELPRHTTQETFPIPLALEDDIDNLRRLGGETLPLGVQIDLGQKLGHNFSHVRIHNNAKAHKLAEMLNARAFTVGRDIVFNQGEYQPETRDGLFLLGHELTHTIQQEGEGTTIHTKRLQRALVSTSHGGTPPATPDGRHTFEHHFTSDADPNLEIGLFPREQNGRLGWIRLPKIPVARINGSHNKGGVNTELGFNSAVAASPEGVPNISPVRATGSHRYLFYGAPQARRHVRSNLAYALWDKQIAESPVPSQFVTNFGGSPTQSPSNLTNAADVRDSSNDENRFYYLVRKKSSGVSISKGSDLFLGTAEDLSQNATIMRPNWEKSTTDAAPDRTFDVDHAHELQQGGANELSNFWLWDRNSNQSFGRKLMRPVGTKWRKLRDASKVADSTWKTTIWDRGRIDPRGRIETILDRFYIQFDGYDFVSDSNYDHYWTQKEIGEAKQMRGLYALSEEDLVTAGIEPGNGQPNFLNIFALRGGGRRVRAECETDNDVKITAGTRQGQQIFPRNNFIDGFQIDNIDWTRSGNLGAAPVAVLRGTMFKTNENIQSSSSVDIPIFSINSNRYTAYLKPSRVQVRRDSVQMRGLSPVDIDQIGISEDFKLTTQGVIRPTKFLFQRINIPVQTRANEIFISFPLPTDGLNFGPVSVDQASLDLGFGEDGLFLRGSADISVDRVGVGHLEATMSRHGPRIEGNFDFAISFLNPASARFVYDMHTDELSLTLSAGVQEGALPGIKSGLVEVTIDKEGVDINGTLNPSGFLEGAQVIVSYTRETGITIELNEYRPPLTRFPAIRDAIVSMGVNKPVDEDAWNFYGNGAAQFAIPNVTGGLNITIRDDVVAITGDGRVEYGPAVGTLNLTVTNQQVDDEGNPLEGQADENFRVFGRGSATVTFGIITATAGLTYTEDGEIIVDGALALPPTFEVFPRRPYEDELLHVEPPEFPIWGVSVAGVGIGIFGFFDAYLSIDAFVGPGTINNAALTAQYTFSRPEDTVIDGNANFNIPAGAGFNIDIGGGVRARLATAQVSGRIGLAARLGLEANAGADVNVHWTPAEGLSLHAEAYANVSPKFRVSANALVRASVDLRLAEPSYTWGPWEQVLGEFGPEMMVEVRFPVDWSEQNGLDLDLDNIQVTQPEVDYADLMKNAFLELV